MTDPSTAAERRVGAVVLAAGGAQRFGAPKQLAELGGKPLLEHVLTAVAASKWIQVSVVVLGAHAERILEKIDLHGVRPVICEDRREGQAASLRAGLGAMDGVDAVLVLLGDQPGVTTAAIDRVIAAAPPGSQISVRATYEKVASHPALLAGELLARAVELHGDTGARELLSGDDVILVACDDIANSSDVDFPRDLRELKPL